jgi:RNA polymerase sigma-70 factor (ECF subfamily)
VTDVPDAEMIARVLVADDRAAFGELVRRHQSAVRRYLRHLTRGDAALADDLAQETFLTAWRGLPRFQGQATFSTWLLGIARNQCRNALRRRRETVPATVLEIPDESAPSPAHLVALGHDLAGALGQLDPDEQEVLYLFYQQGLTHTEISGLLGRPPGTVKTHLARGKDKLRQLLDIWNPST